MEGIIVKALSGFYYVDDGQKIYSCRGRESTVTRR